MVATNKVQFNRATLANSWVSLGGKKLRMNGGSVVGRINAPSLANINVPYSSVDTVVAKAPVRVGCTLTSGNVKVEKILFEGELSGIGRDKHEQNRSLTLTAEGYSNIWFRSSLYTVNEFAPRGMSFGDAYRARSVGSAIGYTAGKQLSDLTNLMQGDLKSFILAILSRVHSGGEAVRKVLVKGDPIVAALFGTGDMARRLYMRLVEGQSSSMSPVLTFLKSILDMTYYEMLDRVGPVPVGRILFKPRTIFSPPPACNIFYPYNYNMFRESRSLLDPPTRMMFQSNVFQEINQAGGSDITTMVRFAPTSLQAKFDSVRSNPSLDAGRVFSTSLTDEESQRGIVPEYGAISPAEWLWARRVGGSEQGADVILSKMAAYKLKVKQLEFSRAVVGHCFAPDIAVGFTGKIVDEKFSLYGLVEQVSHVFGVDGFHSQVSLSHVRESLGSNPGWISSIYSNGSIYDEILGYSASSE